MLYLDHFLITFLDHIMSKRQLLLPLINISMGNQAYVSPKWILTPQKEISCHIFKMAILTKFFGDLMNQMIREYAGKKIKLFLNVSPLKIMDIFLSLFKVSSLYWRMLEGLAGLLEIRLVSSAGNMMYGPLLQSRISFTNASSRSSIFEIG